MGGARRRLAPKVMVCGASVVSGGVLRNDDKIKVYELPVPVASKGKQNPSTVCGQTQVSRDNGSDAHRVNHVNW